jgi:hypothetical protein
MSSTFIKDPDARLDYSINWTAWLATGDTIVSSDWASSAPTTLVVDSDSFDGTSATVVLTGGEIGETYEVRNRITTDAGWIDDRTIKIKIREK